MARKLNRNLVALGSAAIVAVYAVGYMHTQPAAGGAASAAPASVAAPAAATQTAVRRALDRAFRIAPSRGGEDDHEDESARGVPPSVSSTQSATATAQAVASGYRDGTYTGSASNRRGSLSVAVTIQGGRITDVQLTRYEMYYPPSRIARLPGEVIDRQSANVDLVSGATYSAEAFRQAVAQALAQARA